MSGDQPFYRHRDDYRPEMAPALFEGKSVRVQPYTSQNGKWVSSLQPILKTDGTIIGFLEVDLQLDTLLQQTSQQLWTRSIPLIMLAGLAIIVSWLVSNRIAARLVALSEQAKRFAAGDYQTTITAQGQDEVTGVAEALEAGRSSIQEFISRILGTMPGIMVTIQPDMTLGRYASRDASQWFADGTLGRQIHELFANEEQTKSFQDAAGMAFDDAMPLPFADCLGLAPQQLERDGQTWSLTYHPIKRARNSKVSYW